MIEDNDIWNKINFKTKPLGSLGMLEDLAFKICKAQNTLSPQLIEPTIFVFAADHGIANEGVSAYPQDVTWQMVFNFLSNGAAINAFTNQNNIKIHIVDAGVNKDFEPNANLLNYKVAYGTKSFLNEPAMSLSQLQQCQTNAKSLIANLKVTSKCNIIGFGEMGIGNTSSAALIIHCLTGISLNDCVGRGTGISDEQLQKKISVLQKSIKQNAILNQKPIDVMLNYGGFEIATMAYAMLESVEQNLIIMVDGFIASAAFLFASKLNSAISNNAIFCHQSNENGHKFLLDYLDAKPILNLGMRLGEGTGCAVAYPIIKSAVEFVNNMASFESAGVSNK
jgi:nicotinate-nucleotide--dimethylbenzimidazole phosphoribosyltransferase